LPLNGNFHFKEDFESKELPMYWLMLRTPRSEWYSLDDPKGSLTLDLRPETVTGTGNTSFIARRQQHITGEASTKMEFEPASSDEFAGLVAFQSEKNHYAIGKTLSEGGKSVVQLIKSGDEPTVLAENELNGMEGPVYLKVTFDKGNYAFYFATEEDNWRLVQDNVDGTFLSTRVSGGFVGTTLGLYATSNGTSSGTKASFDWF